VRVGKSLAWLNSKKVKEAKGLEKGSSGKVLKEEKQKRN